MYNYEKFGYVVVSIDRKDYCREDLVKDLLDWEYRLGRIDLEDKIVFKGLLPMKGIDNLRLLKDVSPIGNGYDITVDGFDIYEKEWRFNRLCKGA